MNFTSRNEITGAWLKSKRTNNNYRAGFDAIFGKKDEPAQAEATAEEQKPDEEVKEKE